jgi:hypothetical protein
MMKIIYVSKLSMREKKNAVALSIDANCIDKLYELEPDLKSSPMLQDALSSRVGIQQIYIVIYEDKNGESKRRIAMTNQPYETGCEQKFIKEIAASLKIKIDRTLEVIQEQD